MAWRCTGASNAELITNMAQHGLINSERVQAAMKKVDRAHYVRNAREAYEDSPQRIGHGATISAPHMHAHAVEYLLPFLRPGSRILDVGSGSGYLSAVLHYLVTDLDSGVSGTVIGIEHIPELVDWSKTNLQRDGLGAALESGHVKVVTGDGRQAPVGPFDAIHVGAAAPTMPQPLVNQLARPGRMFIPVGEATQSIIQVDKDAEGNVTQKELFGVMYVPLTDQAKQRAVGL
ncbi:protein-L-isoaspartate O-methyltransferase [Fomitopsis schrenkii]|uniref:protein-L-isoaspartate(D-aspartate) O-methyltransferase n=1 Tax=Fomitopsis schrenkii TaxID=2126942 RepID=S8FV31_FOMSC|nr:protein-L-isoaspartate O-methyltransferase [Fomitopsis schrenkii]